MARSFQPPMLMTLTKSAGQVCVLDPYYSGPTNDPYWANVVLLLHCDGTNGGTTFTDSSASAKTVVAQGNAQTTTAGPLFGSACALFDGAGDRLSVSDSTDLDFAAGDFTVEFFVFVTSLSTSPTLIRKSVTSSGFYPFAIFASSSNTTARFYNTSNAVLFAADLSSGAALSTGVWHHIAITRSGSTFRLFIDGIIPPTAGTNTGTGSLNLNSAALSIGSEIDGTLCLNGKIDDIRITKGVARYTGNFIVPTAAYPNALDSGSTAKTVLSLHLNGTNGATTFTDSSYAARTPTVTAPAVLDTSQKQFGTASANFTGGYLQYASADDWNFGSGDFTVETWARFNSDSVGARAIFAGQASSGGSNSTWSISKTTSEQISASGVYGITFAITSTLTVSPNTWYHIALVRSGTLIVLYVNGAIWAAGSISGAFTLSTDFLGVGIVGAYTGAYGTSFGTRMMGWLDEFRITKGVARYGQIPVLIPTAANPDSSPSDPYFSSVKASLHFDGTNGSQVLTDSSSFARAVTCTGAANINTTTKQFGSGSLYLSSIGAGAYSVNMASSTDFNIASGDFTIELWVYQLSTSLGSLVSRRAGGTSFGWAFTDSSLRARINGTWSDTQISWTRPLLNSWHHFALVRSGSILMVFIDGLLTGSLSGVSTLDDQSQNLYLGQSDNATENKFLGYFDDFRFTVGQARYTSSFTPAALPNCDFSSITYTPTPETPATDATKTLTVTNRYDLTISPSSLSNGGKLADVSWNFVGNVKVEISSGSVPLAIFKNWLGSISGASSWNDITQHIVANYPQDYGLTASYSSGSVYLVQKTSVNQGNTGQYPVPAYYGPSGAQYYYNPGAPKTYTIVVSYFAPGRILLGTTTHTITASAS
jgi:hypothetical protein